ncbi:MAG: guanylate kinase [Cytophagaceae bacterium]|jgi:guanylate kinase|nr:guanylate kinase [Cytophagaceae bacterium]
MDTGKLIIFSAPSGSGKTTIVRHLLDTDPRLGFSISACTRTKRTGANSAEAHGKDYYFLSREEFKQKIDDGEFVEYEEVYPGAYYGTLRAEVERIWSLGKHVVFDVDVKGGLKLKKAFGDRALAVFVKVPSIEILEQRLRDRSTDSEESIQSRLFKVKFEMGFEKEFDVTIVNDNLDASLKKAEILVNNFIR